MTLKKRTPCVGICSTTYGDLVCRGCKRFAHEIVQWNGYDAAQQTQIWQRLNTLRDEVVAQHLHVEDREVFAAYAAQAQLTHLSMAEQVYELMRHLVVKSEPLGVAGLAALSGQEDALTALQAVDGEIYARSLAHYERNFKVPV